jgi:membrane protease YdiL (CAAX protease family)
MESISPNRTGVYRPSRKVFWGLLAACVFGIAAVLPYMMALVSFLLKGKPLPLPWAFLAFAQLLQGTVLFAGAIFFGMRLAGKVGLEAPILERWIGPTKKELPPGAVFVPFLAGAGMAAVVLLLLQNVFLPRLAVSPLALDGMVPVWKRFLACFYGGINEELVMRLFLLSLVLWLFKKVARTTALRPALGLFWAANILIAVLFGMAHLGVVRITMELTPMVLATILSANGILGLCFGYLCWKRGIEAAMIAHFSADLVLHVIGPMFLRT